MRCAELISLAEQELSAFVTAVGRAFGRRQAAIAAQDWLEELRSAPSLSSLRRNDFRLLTIAASQRLARRVRVHALVPGYANRESMSGYRE